MANTFYVIYDPASDRYLNDRGGYSATFGRATKFDSALRRRI